MATNRSTISNELSHITWSSVSRGTLVGVIGGAVIGVPMLIVMNPSGLLISLFMGAWIPAMLGGAGSSFLGSVAGLISRQRKYALVTGLLSGAIMGPISWSIFIYIFFWREPLEETIFSPLAIAHGVACGVVGALGSYYSTSIRAAIYRKGCLSTFLFGLLGTGITLLSLTYVRPQDCQRLCSESPCPPGTCQAGEQKAGLPLPVLQDNMTGSSPIGGWGVIGDEDIPNGSFFVVNVVFWSLSLWLFWKAWAWVIPRARHLARRHR